VPATRGLPPRHHGHQRGERPDRHDDAEQREERTERVGPRGLEGLENGFGEGHGGKLIADWRFRIADWGRLVQSAIRNPHSAIIRTSAPRPDRVAPRGWPDTVRTRRRAGPTR